MHHVWDELVSVEVSSLVSFTGIFVLFFVFVLFLNHLCELLNDFDVRLEPLIDSDLYILMLRGKHTLHELPASNITAADPIFDICQQGVISAHFLVPFDQHLRIVQILRTFYLILTLLC